MFHLVRWGQHGEAFTRSLVPLSRSFNGAAAQTRAQMRQGEARHARVVCQLSSGSEPGWHERLCGRKT